ncbi:MAG TPA: hypothetical protein VGG85_07715 [Terracidiphilus sp.]|jgi:hypothetical protein
MEKLLSRARLWFHAGLALAVSLTLLLSPEASGSRKKQPPPQPPPVRATQQPAITIPVDPLGFTPPGSFYLGMRNSLVSLDFLDENHLLFTFRVPGLIHRDLRGADPSDERQIRAVVLRLPQGTVQAETVWTVHDRKRYLWMLDNGQFLFRDRDNLQLGDASLGLKPFLHFPGPVLWVEIDPARKFVVTGSSEPPASASKAGDVPSPASAEATLVSDDKKPTNEPDLVLRILRRDSGKVMLVSHIRSAVHLPINTDGYLETLRSTGKAWVLNLNYFDGGSTVLGSIDSVCAPMLDFVSSAEILATTCGPNGDPRLVALTTAGRHLWEGPTPGASVWPLLVTASDGSRLARETLTASHSVNAFSPLGTDDIKGQDVQIFDAATGKVALRAQASPVYDAGGNVAISPSARRVAVLMAEGIQIFELPAPTPVPDTSVTPARH